MYDGNNPYADFNASGSLTTRYLYGPAIDQLFGRWSATGGEVDWYLGDIVGSVRQIVKSDGTVLDNLTYDSFGKILTETSLSNGDRFKYTGREWDAVFEEYYYRARYYSADTRRFTSQDPLGFAAGDSNLYRYVFNTATRYTDPTGQSFLSGLWDGFVDLIGDIGVGGRGTVQNVVQGALDQALIDQGIQPPSRPGFWEIVLDDVLGIAAAVGVGGSPIPQGPTDWDKVWTDLGRQVPNLVFLWGVCKAWRRARGARGDVHLEPPRAQIVRVFEGDIPPLWVRDIRHQLEPPVPPIDGPPPQPWNGPF